MSLLRTDDNVDLYFESTGSGEPILFVHEFAGDLRAWEPQVRHFSRRHQCVTYNARGYPPSAVPDSDDSYGQQRAVDDLRSIISECADGPVHLIGNSMGAFASLHLALQVPDLLRSLTIAGIGYGSQPELAETFRDEANRIAQSFLETGSKATAHWYGFGAGRLPYRRKDERGHDEHVEQLASHDARGSAYTMRNVQGKRPSLYEMQADLGALQVPTLVIAGDEDDGALDASLMLKREIATASLLVIPGAGHLTNLEEPELFNYACEELMLGATSGTWPRRDLTQRSTSITGA